MPSIHDRNLANNDVFKLVFVGHFFGWGALFLGSLVFMSVGAVLIRPEAVLNEFPKWLLFVAALPVILALQGVLLGAISVLGIRIHRRVSGWFRTGRPAA